MAMKSFICSALLAASLAAAPAPNDAVQVEFDHGEAEAALLIFEKLARGKPATEADWQALFSTAGYRRLKDREAAMGRAFTDADFKAFMQTTRTRKQAVDLRRTLRDWESQPVNIPARLARAYLPADATLKATVFPMIKPKPNEFVFGIPDDPAIFLYLSPDVSGAKARNTLAHELHHIGFGSVCPRPAKASSNPGATKLREWISAYGEGLAMLAAAGGPDIHPHAVSSAKERAEWDANIARVDILLVEQNEYFLQVLDDKAGDATAIDSKMMGYFGVQGPWYTVGWLMASTIEKQLGRPAAIEAFCAPDRLLAIYNKAATLHNRNSARPLPLWDSRLVDALSE